MQLATMATKNVSFPATPEREGLEAVGSFGGPTGEDIVWIVLIAERLGTRPARRRRIGFRLIFSEIPVCNFAAKAR